MTADDDAYELTVDEALAMLVDGEDIHTFLNPAVGIIVGADWSRKEAEDLIRRSPSRKQSGEQALSMKHGIAVQDGRRWVFMQTKEEE